MLGSTAPERFAALPRPDTRFNRCIRRASSARRPRALKLDDLRPLVDESLRTFSRLGASPQSVSAVQRSFARSWSAAETPAPSDVFCGEVVFAHTREPLVLMYPDSPWGRIPQPFYGIASQAAVDHMVAHLLEYFSGAEYGEEAACRDQIRLMLARRRLADTAMAAVIAICHRLHKNVPLRSYGPALRERYGTRARALPDDRDREDPHR